MALSPYPCHLLYNLFPKESYVSVTGKGYLLCFFKVCTLGSYTIKKYLFHSTGLWAGWVYRLQCRSVIGPIQWTELHIRKKTKCILFFTLSSITQKGCLLNSVSLSFYYTLTDLRTLVYWIFFNLFIYTCYHITVRLTSMNDSTDAISITRKGIFIED